MSLASDFIKVADAILGRALCVALAPFGASAPTLDNALPPRRVLVIRPGGIGDAVLFIPMLRALRAAWPNAELDLLAEHRNASVIAPTGLVGHVYRYDRFPIDLLAILRRRYDLVIDTEQFHCLSAIVAWLTRAPRRIGFGTTLRRRLFTQAIGYNLETYEAEMFLALARAATGEECQWDPDTPFYPLPDAARQFAQQALQPLKLKHKVAIHPGASIPERRWPTERYARLAQLLAEHGAGVVVLGGPTDVAAAAQIASALDVSTHVNLAGSCSLVQAAAVVADCDMYVSADSGVLHLAYALGTPTVHLFGPGVLSKWGPPGHRFRSIAAQVPCSPCTTYGYTPPCCQGMVCMLKITPEDVFAAVQAQLSSLDLDVSVPRAEAP
jgi:lipopolysaccharide heptosyltransferase II